MKLGAQVFTVKVRVDGLDELREAILLMRELNQKRGLPGFALRRSHGGGYGGRRGYMDGYYNGDYVGPVYVGYNGEHAPEDDE